VSPDLGPHSLYKRRKIHRLSAIQQEEKAERAALEQGDTQKYMTREEMAQTI
jgi:hypothetical protein